MRGRNPGSRIWWRSAGVYSGRDVFAVNTVAPYVLTASMQKPRRIIYLSSGMHQSGSTNLASVDWSHADKRPGSYSDSKLYVTALWAAVAARWLDVEAHAVDPGWVPTQMGGPSAPDDLELGHLTQAELALRDAGNIDRGIARTGGYWYHQQRRTPHRAVLSSTFQTELLEQLERHTGLGLPE